METKENYICSEKQSNKFWGYTVNNKEVFVKWGRMGIDNFCSKNYYFDNSYDRDEFINKKVSEKLKKGYKKVNDTKLKDESNLAKILGNRNKIKRILWVRKNGNKLEELPNYNHNEYIYVEILDSYKKNISRFILNQNDSWEIYDSIIEQNGVITYGSMGKVDIFNKFVRGIREVLKKLSLEIVEIISARQFGTIGKRNLFGFETEKNNSNKNEDIFENAIKNIDTSMVDDSVISKFASLGKRALIIN